MRSSRDECAIAPITSQNHICYSRKFTFQRLLKKSINITFLNDIIIFRCLSVIYKLLFRIFHHFCYFNVVYKAYYGADKMSNFPPQ